MWDRLVPSQRDLLRWAQPSFLLGSECLRAWQQVDPAQPPDGRATRRQSHQVAPGRPASGCLGLQGAPTGIPPCPHPAVLGQRWAEEVQEAVQSAGAAGWSWPSDRPGPRGPRPQGLQRRLWLSAPEDVAGAACLLRWWGKVGMSSGSQAAGRGPLSARWEGPPTPPSAPRLTLDTVPAARAARACSGPTAHLPNTGPGPGQGPPAKRRPGGGGDSRRGFSLK